MTPEIYTIIATAIALAGLILNNQRTTAKSIAELRRDLNALAERVPRDIATLDEKLSRDIAALDEKLSRNIAALDEKLSRDIAELREQMNHGLAALGERVARLEGFMEGIRDAIAGKAA